MEERDHPVSWSSIWDSTGRAHECTRHPRLQRTGPMDADGNPPHPGDSRRATRSTLAHLEALLTSRRLSSPTSFGSLYARDVDELFKQFSRVNERFGDSRYATTVLGVGQLPARFLVMLEATAVD